LLNFVWTARFGRRSSLYYVLSKDYSSALDLNSNSFTLKPSFFIASLAKLFFQHIKHIIIILLISLVSLFSYTSHIAGDRRRFESIKFKEYVRLEQEEYDRKRYKLRYLREAIKAFEQQKRLERIRARGPSPTRYLAVVKKIRQNSKNLRGLLYYDIKGDYKLNSIWTLRDSFRVARKIRRLIYTIAQQRKKKLEEEKKRQEQKQQGKKPQPKSQKKNNKTKKKVKKDKIN